MWLLIPIVDRVILVVMMSGASRGYLAWRIPFCALIMLRFDVRGGMRS